MAGTIVIQQRGIGLRRVSVVQPDIIVEDFDYRRSIVNPYGIHADAEINDIRRSAWRVSEHVELEPFVRLDLGIAVDEKWDRLDHFRLGLPGDHQAVLFAVEGSPSHQLIAQARIAVLVVEVVGNVLRNRIRAQHVVHDLPIVAQPP